MKPLKFQLETIKKIDKFEGRALIANDTGLGKTYTSLWWVEKTADALPLLVICPAIVKHQWASAIQQILKINPIVLESRKKRDTQKIQCAIINYDIVIDWLDVLLKQNFNTVILDECQMLTNPKAKRTKSSLKLAKQSKYCIALSATPLTNRPIELFPIISTLKPKIWKSRLAYAKRYCNPRLTPWGWDFRGASNLDELHKILKSTCMVRYTTKQVLTTLPGKNRRVIVLDILNRDDYVEAEKNFLHWLKLNYPERYEKSIKAAALVQIGVLLRLAAKKKLKFAVDYINKFIEQNPKRRIVVYAIHKKCLAALKRRINAKSAIIDGSTPHNKRREIITAFRAGRLTVLIANILAAGVGINLQVSDTMFVLELPFKPGPLLQIEGRIHRLGQSMVSNINYLIAKNTIEEKLIKLIQSKEQTIATVLDGKNSADLNLLELLLKELYDQHSRSA